MGFDLFTQRCDQLQIAVAKVGIGALSELS